jgi:hypothetical protein
MLKDYAGVKDISDETQTHLNMVNNNHNINFVLLLFQRQFRLFMTQILLELYSRVRGTKSNRGNILQSLYGLVECSSPKILLAIARVVLALNVSGSNLTGACKLVFKVARNEVNDSLFIDSDVPELLVDALGKVNPTNEGE